MQNFEDWVTDWDINLTKKEQEVVMQETWRAGLYLSAGDLRRHGSVSNALKAVANNKK